MPPQSSFLILFKLKAAAETSAKWCLTDLITCIPWNGVYPQDVQSIKTSVNPRTCPDLGMPSAQQEESPREIALNFVLLPLWYFITFHDIMGGQQKSLYRWRLLVHVSIYS